MKRGDVLLIDFPFSDGRAGKIRPALVVQHDRENGRLTNTIVAMFSGDLRHAGEPTHVLVDPATPEGSSSGLHGRSVVKCINLYTVAQAKALRMLGRLSGVLMQQVNDALKAALDLS